jgi:hypothetical protein
MVSPNEFWLHLHALSESYLAEGMTADERFDNIVSQFRDMPAIAQRELLGPLVQLAGVLPDLYPPIVGAVNETESANRARREHASQNGTSIG